MSTDLHDQKNASAMRFSIEMTTKIHKDKIYVTFWMFGTRLNKFIFIMDLKMNLLNVVEYKINLEKMKDYNLTLDQKAYCLNILFMRYINIETISKKMKLDYNIDNKDIVEETKVTSNKRFSESVINPNINNTPKVEVPVKKSEDLKKRKAMNRGADTKNKYTDKFPLPIKNCRFHYPFGKDNPPKNRVSFTIRADYNNAKLGIKIKYKSFELNDYGLLNARYYLDTELRKHKGTKKALYFSNEEFKYIEDFGIVNFKKHTKYKSGVNYKKYTQIILDRYLTLAEQYHIEQSYSKNVIILKR
jgi:hypothetical protein